MPEEPRGPRDHIFISYAWEDGVLAEWLALKLTAEGYAVWIDRFKLLGGEPYPQDIDDAIRYRTFRLLALLSRTSIPKPNPRKERTLALNLGRERKEDFLIPLNVDGLRPSELDWMTSDLTFISFQESWSEGYMQVLKKLDSLDAPRPVQNGGAIAASMYLPTDVLLAEPEVLRSNLFPIERIPPMVRSFDLRRPLERAEQRYLAEHWAFRKVDDTRMLAFRTPPVALSDPGWIMESGTYSWADVGEIQGIRSLDVVTELIKKSLERKCIERGLAWVEGKWVTYFPAGLLPKDQITFHGYKPKKSRVQVTGVRKFSSSEKYRYHLSPAFSVRRGITAEFIIQLRIRAYLTDLQGKPLKSELIAPRRKRLARGWWNLEWLLRHMGVMAHLADEQASVSIGEGDEELRISASPLAYEVPVRINEKALAREATPESEPQSQEDIDDAA